MKLTEEQIGDLRIVLQAARDHMRCEPHANTEAAITVLEELIEEHENN